MKLRDSTSTQVEKPGRNRQRRLRETARVVGRNLGEGGSRGKWRFQGGGSDGLSKITAEN